MGIHSMQDIFTGLLYVFSELGAVLLLLFFFLAWKLVKRKVNNKNHVKDFMGSYNDRKSENTSSIISSFKTACNIEDETAKKLAGSINASERKLYRRVLNLILGNEKNNLFEIQKDMVGLSESWMGVLKIAAKSTAEVGESKVDNAHLSKQNEFLKSENSRLSDNYLHVRSRLQTAVELLENLVKEYSMLYSEGESSQIVEAIEEELNEMKRSMEEADEKAMAKSSENK